MADKQGQMGHLRKQTIWDVLNPPRTPSLLVSPAPGTGPYQHDTLATQAPQAFGGKVIPTLQKPNATGYGGGGDAVEGAGLPADPPTATAVHSALLHKYPTVAHHGPGQVTLPRFNQLYDTLRTDRAWLYTADYAVAGSITPAAGNAIASQVVALPANQGLRTIRLSEFPGGIQAHLFVQQWGIAAVAGTMTGAVYFSFVDQWGGSTVSLSANNGPSYNTDLTNVNKLCPTPISDAGNTALGTLFAQSNTIVTPVACQWFLAFSLVYVLPDPAYNGYTDELVHAIREEQRRVDEK